MKQEDGLRSWLKQADDLGELRTIEGADWDLEIGGVADIVTERGSSPAVLFDSIKELSKRLSRAGQLVGFDQAARVELGNAAGP